MISKADTTISSQGNKESMCFQGALNIFKEDNSKLDRKENNKNNL